MMPELVVDGIVLAPVIVALIELFKRLGMPVDLAPWANGVLSLAGYGVVVLIAQQPDLIEPVKIALNAVIVFLTGAGLYTTIKHVLRR
jgi:hypothetical protein